MCCRLDVCSELDYECEFVQKWQRLLAPKMDHKCCINCTCLLAVLGDLWSAMPPLGQAPAQERLSLVCWLGFGGGELEFFPPKPGGFRQHKVGSWVEIMLGCRVLYWIVGFALSLVFVWSEETMLTLGVESPPWIFGLISGFNGGWELFHWHGVVVEFIVNWQPRCSTRKGCVHVSNLPM